MKRWWKRIFLLMAVAWGLGVSPGLPELLADGKTQSAKELAEYVARHFGPQVVKESTEVLARKIESAAARHGNEIFEAVRKVGPRALPLVEQAGAHGSQAARILAQHGEQGAAWVLARPSAMKLVLQHGEGAAGVLVKHAGGIAEPVVEQFGAKAVKALEATGPQSGRRMAMLLADGELGKIGHTEELLDVVSKFGDRAVDFIWKNKAGLCVGTALTAFLVNPEPFLSTAQGVTETVAENAVRPLAEIPAAAVKGVAEGTDWTEVIISVLLACSGFVCLFLWLGHRNTRVLRVEPPSTNVSQPS